MIHHEKDLDMDDMRTLMELAAVPLLIFCTAHLGIRYLRWRKGRR